MKEKEKQESEDNFDKFTFEVSSSESEREIINELELTEFEDIVEEESPKPKTIKILAERDIKVKENPPPNYSNKFKCILHFKNKDYKQRQLLKTVYPIAENDE